MTEITTGLAMLGYQSLDRALEVRPRHITHVDEETFERLEAARASGDFDRDFEAAWQNGVAFARSPLGLRGRPPWTLEWKGPHRPASRSIETIPADLRVDHVYLVSCKYQSRILHNSSPAGLFEHGLRRPPGATVRSNWFDVVSPAEFRAFWNPIYAAAGVPVGQSSGLATREQRDRLAAHLAANPIDTRSADYLAFVLAASTASAERWRATLAGRAAMSEMYWRLLRMQAAPYFVVGALGGAPVAYRVGTPWDFAQRFRVLELRIDAGDRGQPSVDWHATVSGDAGIVAVRGYVEIRWSHGKLAGPPEAKVYLSSHPLDVPGYDALD